MRTLKKILNANKVVRWFLMKNNEYTKQYPEDVESLTHLKIQKLLYYAQGVHLAYTGYELFPEEILAWEHGPVIKEVYDTYKPYGNKPIEYNWEDDDSEIIDLLNENVQSRNVLETVFDDFGKYSALELRNMTHNERPWKNTNLNSVIDKNIIKDFFKEEILEE